MAKIKEEKKNILEKKGMDGDSLRPISLMLADRHKSIDKTNDSKENKRIRHSKKNILFFIIILHYYYFYFF